MAFGKKEAKQRETTQSTQQQNQNQTQTSNVDFINVEDEIRPTEEDASQSSQTPNNKKPLLDEVTMIDAPKGKNAGALKNGGANIATRHSAAHIQESIITFLVLL